MGQFENAKELVEYCKTTLKKIEKAYDESLVNKEIKTTLLIEIKNFMENLRSALDYTAHELYDKYCHSSNPNPSIYFPYAWGTCDKGRFQAEEIIENKIPGLTASRPDIVAKIETYQHFDDPRNNWLPVFMDLNNKNKHQELTAQVIKERKKLKISSEGRTMTLGGRMSISKGYQMKMGKMIILGGQSFDANNPPITSGEGTIEIITWSSFHFSTNNVLVLPFLEQALNGTENIINELSEI